MSTSRILHHLYSLDTSSPDLLRCLYYLIQNDDEEQYLPSLQGSELTRLVDFLDGVLDVTPITDDVSRRCLHKLQAICGHHKILPSSYNVSGDLAGVDSDPVASGGFSDVWEGFHHGKKVCIKRLRVTQQTRLAAEKAFCKEAVMWKRLKHPNIVGFIGVTRNPLRFVSDWMPNGILTEYLEDNPGANRIGLLLDVAEGLTFLHAIYTTHGDLKGPNVLIDHSGHARLTDFGFTSVVRGVDSVLVTEVQGYSARWAAPEVLRNGDRNTREADVFAFGMIVVEVFTGRHPFSEFPALVAISKIMSGERPDRPQESSLIDSVWDTTLRCWDEDPVQRPTMTRVVGTLRECSRPCDGDLGPSTLAPLPQEVLAPLPESEGAESTGGLNHGVRCNSCSQVIIGTLYQCGSCPTIPYPYNLCQLCDDKSYTVHDPTHIFFKLPRPVDRAILTTHPILPILYKHRVASDGILDARDPKAYLRNVMHVNIYCDLCMEPIRGQWFHCVYCPRDLCSSHCEEVDGHDRTHFSLVAKAPVDMHKFYRFTEMSAEDASGLPIMKYPVYYS